MALSEIPEKIELDDLDKFCEFVSRRITELRLQKNVSEYQMSLDIGQNRTYIQNISSRRSMPSLHALFKICSYFGITPVEFFDKTLDTPQIYTEAKKELFQLSPKDIEILLPVIKRFPHDNGIENERGAEK